MHAYHRGRLSATDASFLYFERAESPMHIGALALFDGELPYEDYVRGVEAKLAKLPRFRERVVATPFFLGHPTWETDHAFDVAVHMPLHHLPAPGGEEELHALVDKLLAERLDRERALWQVHVVHGLADGRSAIVTKVHHAMVDGVGGNAILTTLLDFEPQPPKRKAEENGKYEPTRDADSRERVADAMWDSTSQSIEVWAKHFQRLTELGRSFDAERVQSAISMLGEAIPDLALPPRRLPFNRPCGTERRFVWTSFSFAEARAIRAALGGTVNDVILTTLGGAVSRYCELHGQPVENRSMRVMVPVNVRPRDAAADLGNQVSVLPVNVPLGSEDPVQRLRAVRATTRTLKEGRVAEGVSMMVNLAAAVPAPLQAAFGAIAVSPVPVFNIVCTNVPGPQIPLYAEGLKMTEYYPYIPVGFDMGVGCAIFSYNQQLFVGLNSDTKACPDVDKLRDFLEASFAELKALAAVEDIAELSTRPPRKREGEPARAGQESVRPGAAAAAAQPAPKRKVAKKRASKAGEKVSKAPAKRKTVRKTTRTKPGTRRKSEAEKEPGSSESHATR